MSEIWKRKKEELIPISNSYAAKIDETGDEEKRLYSGTEKAMDEILQDFPEYAEGLRDVRASPASNEGGVSLLLKTIKVFNTPEELSKAVARSYSKPGILKKKLKEGRSATYEFHLPEDGVIAQLDGIFIYDASKLDDNAWSRIDELLSQYDVRKKELKEKQEELAKTSNNIQEI